MRRQRCVQQHQTRLGRRRHRNNHESPASGAGMWRGGESLLRGGEVMEGAEIRSRGKGQHRCVRQELRRRIPEGDKVLRTTTGWPRVRER
jgi:hypothetical protein